MIMTIEDDDEPAVDVDSDDGERFLHRCEIDADEAYGEQEKALSEFLKLHPMLSLCAAALSS